VIGIPVGIAVGRFTWRVAVSSLGMVDVPSMPWIACAASVAAFLAGALVIAIGPGWAATRRRPVDALRTE